MDYVPTADTDRIGGMTDVDELAPADSIAPADDAAPPPSAVRREHWAAIVLPPLVFGAAVVGVWYFISYVVLIPRRRFLLQPPHLVLERGFLDWDVFSKILESLWATSKVAMTGLIVSIVLGVAIAVLMSQSKLVERATFPYMVMLQAVPILAISPLIGFWFGYANNSRVIVVVIISLFPIVVNTLLGLQSADRSMHELFDLQQASRLVRLRKLMFPAALPTMFAGLRISAGLSVIGAIVGDFVYGRGQAGIGQRLKTYASQGQGEELLTAVIMSCLLGVAVFLFFGWLANRLTRAWSDNGGRS
jgi:NitT/TauT family transport system permease protein